VRACVHRDPLQLCARSVGFDTFWKWIKWKCQVTNEAKAAAEGSKECEQKRPENEQQMEAAGAAKQLVAQQGAAKQLDNYVLLNLPGAKQTNTYDCGVFVMHYMEVRSSPPQCCPKLAICCSPSNVSYVTCPKPYTPRAPQPTRHPSCSVWHCMSRWGSRQ